MSRHQPTEICSNRSSCRIRSSRSKHREIARDAKEDVALHYLSFETSPKIDFGKFRQGEYVRVPPRKRHRSRHRTSPLHGTHDTSSQSIRKDLHVEARSLQETAQKHGDTCSGWLRFRRENDTRLEASYSYTATKGICKASSCAVRSPMSALRRIQVQSFALATVSVTVSLGAKPAQAEGEWFNCTQLDTVALLHTCFPCLHTCLTHLTILPTHSRWLNWFARKQSCI